MRCYRCMKEFPDGYDICPHCGYDMEEPPRVINHLYPGTVLADRYMIGVVVGSGGFGVVYKAWDMQLAHLVCVKEYFPVEYTNRAPGTKDVIVYSGQREEGFSAGLERFLDEAQNLAKFSKHENVVNVYNYFEENNTAYFVMEYLGKHTLKDELVDEEGYVLKLPPDRVKEIGVAVLSALKAIHEEKIIHRDIAPDNIFVLDEGKIKLLDFGAARLSERTDQTRFITLKPGYAPPEQYRSNGSSQGPWTDIYALGATLYRALTGRVPDESTDRVKKDELPEPKDLVEGVPESLNNAIMRAMATDISYRFQSAQEFEDALTDKKQILALQEEIRVRKRKRAISLVASILLLLVCAGWLAHRLITVQDGNSLKGELAVWISAGDGENAAQVEAYYKNVAEQVFLKDFQKVKLDVLVIPEGEYAGRLQEAFAAGDGPEIYESSEDPTLLSYAEELDTLAGELQSGDQEYYFLSDYRKYVPDGKRLPIGYSIPVAYSVGRDARYTVVMNQVEKPADGWELSDADLKKLDGSRTVYLLGDSRDFDRVQKQIYGTYGETKETVAGKLNLSAVKETTPSFTTTFSVASDCSRKEQRAAEMFLKYMLSYQEQHILHAEGHTDGVSESDAFSVNVQADQEYRRQIRSAFDVLDGIMDDYRK